MSIEKLSFQDKLSIFKAYDRSASTKPDIKGELNGKFVTQEGTGSVLSTALIFGSLAPSIEKRKVSSGDECDIELKLTDSPSAGENESLEAGVDNDSGRLGGNKASWMTWDTIQTDIDKLECELEEYIAKAESDLKSCSKDEGFYHSTADEKNVSVTERVDALRMPLTHSYYALAFDLDLEDEDTGNSDGFAMEDEVAVFDARTRAQQAMKDFDLFTDSDENVDFLEPMDNATVSERTVAEVPVKEAVSKHLTESKIKNEDFKGHVGRMKAFFEAASAA
ncbi:hypothetical protein GCM10023116_42140 [Kistimonas scapharcae]|uniref:Uncharacterized protein n=1 Tax=Kistimonas scapharcae TaxID=1036133 RepID=A0ABP8V7D9_9GAMM